MHIVDVSEFYSDFGGGVRTYVRQKLEASARAGIRTTILAPGPAVIEAQIIERVDPVYPPECEASAAAAETVDLLFTITPEGAVVSERVAAATNPCFERAALNALKRWRFSPRRIDGAPRPAYEQQVSLRFDRPS